MEIEQEDRLQTVTTQGRDVEWQEPASESRPPRRFVSRARTGREKEMTIYSQRANAKTTSHPVVSALKTCISSKQEIFAISEGYQSLHKEWVTLDILRISVDKTN